MGRNVSADEFVNCVVRRCDQDMYLKPSSLICASLIPLLVGTIASIMVYASELGVTQSPLPDHAAKTFVVGLFIAFITELALISFLIFCINRRNGSHLNRDNTWMGSLCDYVDDHGGDSAKMRDLLGKNRNRLGKAVETFSKGIWILMVIILLVSGMFLLQMDMDENIDGLIAKGMLAAAPLVLLLLFQFVTTLSAVFTFPSWHDYRQSEFTKELQTQCSRFGLRIDAMDHTVKRRYLIIHILLTLLTLGLYSVVFLTFSCRAMNKHLLNQWTYEEELAYRIIEFEGGSGIEATDIGRKGKVAGLFGNIF